jgi:multiple sugar transport system ATP-binding protein
MRAEISELQDRFGVTTVYVTHDQVEAMTLGDRVAVMRKGELQQVAAPEEVYERPANLFVGGFIGSPAMNMLEATLVPDNGRMHVAVGDQRLELGEEALAACPGLRAYAGKPVVLGVRPENLEDPALLPEHPAERRLQGVVALREGLGSDVIVHLRVDAKPALTEDVRELARDVGQEERLGTGDRAVVVGRFGAHSELRVGQTVEAVVDTTALHFFDPDTGAGIYENT